MEEMATIIWAGLVHEDKNLTSDRVMDIVDNSKLTVTEVFETAGEALNKAFNGDEEVEEPGKKRVEGKEPEPFNIYKQMELAFSIGINISEFWELNPL